MSEEEDATAEWMLRNKDEITFLDESEHREAAQPAPADDLERATWLDGEVLRTGEPTCKECDQTRLEGHASDCVRGRLLAALREERERCAKIAEEHPAMESHELAAAIRKGE